MRVLTEIESLRRAVVAEDFSTVRECCQNLTSAAAVRLNETGTTTEQIDEIEQEVMDFLDWARSALRCSRSHIEYRIRNVAAAAAYHAKSVPREVTLDLDA